MTESNNKSGLNRREFMAATAAAGAVATAASSPAKAAPKRGGTLRYATRTDGRGLDPHRNFVYYVSNPL